VPLDTEPQYPPSRYSALAVAAFVLDFIFAPAGIVCAHIALAQAKQNRDRGRAFSEAALAIGYGILALGIIGLALQTIR
jgi:hypothetical protein